MWRVLSLCVFLFVFVACENEPVTLGGYGTDHTIIVNPPEPSTESSMAIGSEPFTLVAATLSGTMGSLVDFHFDQVFVRGGSSDSGTSLTMDASTEVGSAMVQLEIEGYGLDELADGPSPQALSSSFGCSANGDRPFENEIDVDDIDVGDPVTLENGDLTVEMTMHFRFEGGSQHVNASLMFTPGVW